MTSRKASEGKAAVTTKLMRTLAALLAAVLAASGAAGASPVEHDPTLPTTRQIGGSAYYPISPRRILDTRFGVGVAAPIGPGGTAILDVRASGAVPAASVGVVLNVTAANATELSFITIWPAAEARPEASSLNPTAGLIAPNAVVTRLDNSGRIAIYNAAGTVQVIGDVVGYFLPVAVPKPTVKYLPESGTESWDVAFGNPLRVLPTVLVNVPAGTHKLTAGLQMALGAEVVATCGWAYNIVGDPTDRPLGGRFSRSNPHLTIVYDVLNFSVVADIPANANKVYVVCTLDRTSFNSGTPSIVLMYEDGANSVEPVTTKPM